MRTLLHALALASVTASSAFATDLGRITLDERTDFPVLLEGGFDLVEVHPEHPTLGEFAPPAVDVLLHGGDLRQLRALGFEVEILHENYEDVIARSLSKIQHVMAQGPPNYGQGSMGGYYTFSEIVAVIDHYVTTFPNIVSAKQAIGTTHEGRTIWAFKISDNPNTTENEPRTMFDALHHAREPMSAHTMLWVVDHITANYGTDPVITQLVDDRETWFVPCVNPDGYVYNETNNPGGGGLWRKNRRNNAGSCEGVDLNRNWPTAWGVDNQGSSSDTCSETYRGPSALSEPETQALEAFMTGKGFRTSWSMHTHGQWLLEPYGWQPVSPNPAYPEYSADMSAFNGYIAGVGYTLLYPANGIAIDHYNDAHNCIAYTPEIGYAFWPNIGDAIGIAEENVEPALLMMKYAGSWVAPINTVVSEQTGNANGAIDAGETGAVVATARNKGQLATSGGVTATLSTTNPNITIVNGVANLGQMGSLTNASNGVPLTFQVGAVAPGTSADLTLTLAWDSFSVDVDVPVIIGSERPILRDDLEADRAWVVGAPGDQATTGIWERANPNQVTSSGNVTQPGDDTTPNPGTDCFVTGNDASSAGSDDVDGDTTTLTTPLFDLSAAASPVVRYQRHFYTSGGDPLTTSISNDAGQSWSVVSTLTTTANQWTEVEFNVVDHVAPTASMLVRWQIKDDPNNSLAEAAIDDFEVLDYAVTPHLSVLGKAALGQTFELQLAGSPGKQWILYLSTGTGSATVGGVAGTFGLNPASFVFIGSSVYPTDGLARLALPVPNNGALVGASAFFQTIGDVPPATFSNVVGITVTPN